jgi:hypothetical protein
MGSRDVLENSPILTSTRRTGHPSAMEVNHLTAKRVIFSGRQEVRPIVTIQRLYVWLSLGCACSPSWRPHWPSRSPHRSLLPLVASLK